MHVRTAYECPSPKDSSKNRVIFSHLIGSWKIYSNRQGHSQKQIMTDVMSKKRVVTKAILFVGV